MSDARDALALSLLPGIGPVRCRELLTAHGTPTRAWLAVASGTAASRALRDAEAALARAKHIGARVLAADSVDYPAPLHELPDPPAALFALGDATLLSRPSVAIVGTRSASAYGERIAELLGAALARAGATVVSGMARGVDAAAHRGALAAGGATAAVLGTGVDVPYPAAHAALHREIAERGVVVSEELPGARATPGSFPKRNRIIAGLATLTIVVEAGAKSGAMITAGRALDLGRTVAAVPGAIDAPQSVGSNELLRDGAAVIADVADALTLAGLTPGARRDPAFGSAAEGAVWLALAGGSASLEALTSRANLPVRDCLTAVTALEIAGVVECAPTGEIRRR